MRKAIFSLFFLTVFFGALNAQQITVTSPAAGNTWAIGGTYSIIWTKSGTMPATVMVRLRRAGAPETEPSVLFISQSTAIDGSLSWTIPASVPAGDYFIRVNTTNPIVTGDSGVFTIAPFQVIHGVEKPQIFMLLLPDLVVCLNWDGEIPYIYGNQRIKVRVRNIGLANSTPTLFKIYVEGHGTLTLLAPWLAPNAEYNWSQLFKWKTCGHKTVRATVDPNGQIAESNETNNMLQGSIKVSCGETGFLLEMNRCSDQN